MPATNTQICCCGASTWTAVIGWIQIVASVLAALGYLVAIVALGTDEAKGKVDEDTRVGALALSWLMLLDSFVNIGLGILLVIGNKREHLKMLWTWVILSLISYGCTLLMGIYQITTGNSAQASSQFLSAAIMGFFIYCVHRRIKDIEVNQQTIGYNAAKLEGVL